MQGRRLSVDNYPAGSSHFGISSLPAEAYVVVRIAKAEGKRQKKETLKFDETKPRSPIESVKLGGKGPKTKPNEAEVVKSHLRPLESAHAGAEAAQGSGGRGPRSASGVPAFGLLSLTLYLSLRYR